MAKRQGRLREVELGMTAEYVWGIDPAISRVAFACADLESETVEVETLLTATDAREGERLGLLDRQVRIFARQLAGRYRPAVIWIEQPSGRFRALQLTYAVGVLQAALFETLACPVWTIPSSTWKQRTIGRGNATKEQVRTYIDRLGVNVRDQDEADAAAIALAGRAMLNARSWEATA
jgi:Holliday junction resolvasome RuvABC endonuclease subunit